MKRLMHVAQHFAQQRDHQQPVAVVQAAVAPAAVAAEQMEADGAALDAGRRRQHLFEFVTRGVTVVGPEEHGLPTAVHSTIWNNIKAGNSGDGMGTRMAEVVQMLNSPGMTNALNAIMGEGWAVVPFIHSGFGGSGNNDQTW
jgi:hypothetical protein